MTSESRELVALLHEAFFGREPDASGLAYWSGLVEQGIPAADLVRKLLSTDEAAHKAPLRRWFRWERPTPSWWESEFAGSTSGLVVTDVGAAPLSYEDDVYRPLLRLPNSRLTCFEPNPRRASEVRVKYPQAEVVQSCVADGTQRTFYESGVTSSLYPPNPRTATDLLELVDALTVASSSPVNTVRLDDVAAAHGTHFLKLDVQAGERDVLRHASAVLHSALAVHTELEFYPIYADQPLGWEVWRELDEAGFDLYWFHYLQPYRMRAVSEPVGLVPHRLGWADAVFCPKPDRLLDLDTADVLKLCAIWHDVYHAVDHCQWLLEHHPSTDVGNHAAGYVRLVRGDEGQAMPESPPARC
jgi:FkbM family methyltransferase